MSLQESLVVDGVDGHSSRSHSSRRSHRRSYRSRSPSRRSRSPSRRHRSPSRQRRSPSRQGRSPSSVDINTIHELGKDGGADVVELPQDECSQAEPSNTLSSFEELLGEEGALLTSNSFDLHDSLATRWTAILKTGLYQETRSKIIKKYDPPNNCTFLVAPKLNEEVGAAMNESGLKRDKRIVEQQVTLGAAITSIGKVLSNLIESQEIGNAQHIETLSDSARLLCDLYHNNCMTRRSLILPGLNKDMKELMEQTQISEYLFGDKLQDRVNAIKAVKKSGLELKNTPATAKPPMKFTQKHLNYRGPQRTQVPRPSGQKLKVRRLAYNPKITQQPRRTPQNQHHRRQDRR